VIPEPFRRTGLKLHSRTLGPTERVLVEGSPGWLETKQPRQGKPPELLRGSCQTEGPPSDVQNGISEKLRGLAT
jgi:hypothetical protein